MIFIHKDMTGLSAAARGAVLAIGNFDGLHKGHQALVAKARDLAKAAGAPVGVMSFEPHPRRFFQPAAEPFRLSLLPEKIRMLDSLGVDHFFVPDFNAAFAALSPDDFIALLKEKLNVRQVVVGGCFAFGKEAKGNIDLLRQSLDVTVVDAVADNGGLVYSSTRVRAALQQADFSAAAEILGRPWKMESEVIEGDKRGRTIGYPTANQHVSEYVRIPYGVYAVRVKIEGEDNYREGVANFGVRPMFRVEEPLLETYIFDFDGDIYGKILTVQPVKRLRAEMNFDGLEALKVQIEQDCHAARSYLSSRV